MGLASFYDSFSIEEEFRRVAFHGFEELVEQRTLTSKKLKVKEAQFGELQNQRTSNFEGYKHQRTSRSSRTRLN